MVATSDILILTVLGLSTTFIQTTMVLNCNTTQPAVGSSVMCTCFSGKKNDVRWYMNNTTLTNCLQALNKCIPSAAGYNFSLDANNSGTSYFATISSYDYSYCAEYTCHDLDEPDNSMSKYLWITDFDLNLTSLVTEPLLHESGNITITTECLFMPNTQYPGDIITTWYKVENDSSVSLYHEANEGESIVTDPSACQTCNGNTAVKLVVTYFHKDENTSYQYVEFMLHIYDKANPANGKNITTLNKHRIKVSVDLGDTTSNGSDYGLKIGLSVAAFIIIGLVVVIGFYNCVCIKNFKYTDRTNSMIQLQWEVVYCCMPTRTVLTFLPFMQVNTPEPIEYTTRPLMEERITGLKEGTNYCFYLESESKMCYTAKAELTVDTLARPDPPTDFCIDENNITNSSVLLQWKKGYNGGCRQHFMVMHSETNHPWESKYVDGSKETVQNYIKECINTLKSRTRYNFKVYAANEFGKSPTSKTLRVYTKGNPDAPTELKVIRVTKSSIAIQWKPGYNGGYEQEFIVMYSKHDLDRTSENSKSSEENIEWVSERIKCSDNDHMEYPIGKLSEGGSYNIKIYAENKCGETSTLHLPHCVTTAENNKMQLRQNRSKHSN